MAIHANNPHSHPTVFEYTVTKTMKSSTYWHRELDTWQTCPGIGNWTFNKHVLEIHFNTMPFPFFPTSNFRQVVHEDNEDTPVNDELGTKVHSNQSSCRTSGIILQPWGLWEEKKTQLFLHLFSSNGTIETSIVLLMNNSMETHFSLKITMCWTIHPLAWVLSNTMHTTLKQWISTYSLCLFTNLMITIYHYLVMKSVCYE